ncbi:hypothetical protein POV27_11260 [Aureisphaera galaxeae]|uniref:hypothetical protein n=1 Tax=Aureisphaera galaxeae TaxID=1538023 RepID=UPI00234FFD08|nr:hypothetical protein [Aureisphaera galaxeae]MDC8004629.1 hypothetical protein [Aureisphaera galaxeae]
MRVVHYILLFYVASCFLSCSNDDDGDPIVDPTPAFNAPTVTVIAVDNGNLVELTVEGSTAAVTRVDLTSGSGVTPNDFVNANENTLTWFRRQGPNFRVWKRDLDSKEMEMYDEICSISAEFPAFVLGSKEKIVAFSEIDFGQSSVANIRITENGENCVLTQLFDTGILSATISEDLWVFQNSGTENTLQRISLDSGEIKAATALSETSVSITQNEDNLYVFFNDRYHVYNANTLSLSNVVPFIPSAGILLNNGFFTTQFSGNLMLTSLDVPQPSTLTDWPGVIDLSDGTLVSGDNLGIFLDSNLRQTEGYGDVSLENYTVDLESGIIAYTFSNGSTQHGILFTNFDAEILKIVDLELAPAQIYLTQ